jgi:hypothetical protein
VAAIGNGAGFKHGATSGAWLGLVPKQESTGDRTSRGKLSKRGNKYLRTLFVQAAHVVLVRRPNAAMRGLWPWIEQASKRLHVTCWRSRSPTSLPASPGRVSPAVEPISQGSQQMSRDKSLFRSTKGMPATPLRHRHSPHAASERRWLRGDDPSEQTSGHDANFVVEWAAAGQITEPLIEAVMVGTLGAQGFSFTSRGKTMTIGPTSR